MRHSLLLPGLTFMLLAACTGGAPAMEESSAGRSDRLENCRILDIESWFTEFTLAPITPVTRRHRIVAEFADHGDARRTGLQHRFPLPATTAMLFPFSGTENPVMWMKDTPASLDVLFIAADGTLIYGEYGTRPYSESPITPEDPMPIAAYVLELPAGRAMQLGLVPGSARIRPGPTLPCTP